MIDGAVYTGMTMGGAVIPPPGSRGLHKWNFLGKVNEEILNEDKLIH